MTYPRTVKSNDITFHLRTTSRLPGEPYYLRFQADRPLTDAEVTRFAQIVGYAWASKVRGESLLQPVRDGEASFYLFADSTKSRRDDLGLAMQEFENTLSTYVYEGSPIRTTNRAGTGTKGTRLVEPIPGIHFVLYYDDVIEA